MDDAAADDLIADLLGGGGEAQEQGEEENNNNKQQLHQSVQGSGRRETLSQQLGWLREGLPRSLWKPLTSRASGILLGEVALLRPYFVDQRLVTSTRCSCSQCDELFAAPLKLPCGDTFCTECVEDAAECPLCAAPLQLDGDGRPLNARPVSLGALLGGAVLACPLGDCDWQGTLEQIVPHVEHLCEYRPMQCPFVKCRAMLVRCQLAMHEKLCDNRHLGTKEDKRRQHAAERAALKAATGSDLPPWGGVVDADTSGGLDVDKPPPALGPPPAVVQRRPDGAPPATPPPSAGHHMPVLPQRLPARSLAATSPPPARSSPPAGATRSPPIGGGPQRSPMPPTAGRPAPSRVPVRRAAAVPPRPNRGPPMGPPDEDAPPPVVLPVDARALPPTAPPRPARPKRSTILMEEAPLVLEPTPALTDSSPVSTAVQRMSVLVGNIGALQMKLKEQALAEDERAMYASELNRAIEDHGATQQHLQRHAPEVLAPLAPTRAPPSAPVPVRPPPPSDPLAARRAPVASPVAGARSPLAPVFRLPPLDIGHAVSREQPPAMPPREQPPAMPPRELSAAPPSVPPRESFVAGPPATPLRESFAGPPSTPMRESMSAQTTGDEQGGKIAFSRPMDVKRNPEAVAAMLAAAGLDTSVLDRSAASLTSPPLSPRRTDISRPTEVRRNPEAVMALLASAGLDASVLERGSDMRASKVDLSSLPEPPDRRKDVSSPTNVQHNTEAVRALLAQAGYDASVLTPAASRAPSMQLSTAEPAASRTSMAQVGTVESMPPTPLHSGDAPTKHAPPAHLSSPTHSPRGNAPSMPPSQLSPRSAAAAAAAPPVEEYTFDEPPLSPISQTRMWAAHKDMSKQASLRDYEKLYRDAGTATGAEVDAKPKPPPGAPPTAAVRASATGANVFVDVDVLLPGNELILAVMVAWNSFSSKIRVHRDEPLVATRDNIVSLLIGRGLMPAHGDTHTERYQLSRVDGPRRGARIDLRMSSVGNELVHLSTLMIEDVGLVDTPPPPPASERASAVLDGRPKTPRGNAGAPPPPPPDDDDATWSDSGSGSDDDGGEGNDQMRRTASGSRRPPPAATSSSKRSVTFSPAVEALLTLARMKHHQEVERLLPTLSSEERHAFKSEIRRRREEKKRREAAHHRGSKRR